MLSSSILENCPELESLTAIAICPVVLSIADPLRYHRIFVVDVIRINADKSLHMLTRLALSRMNFNCEQFE